MCSPVVLRKRGLEVHHKKPPGDQTRGLHERRATMPYATIALNLELHCEIDFRLRLALVGL